MTSRERRAARLTGNLHQVGEVYHHTSMLIANELWKSGALNPLPPTWPHPYLKSFRLGGKGVVRAGLPPLIWFTRRTRTPECLRGGSGFCDENGHLLPNAPTFPAGITMAGLTDILAVHRMAIGVRVRDAASLLPWADHPGYVTEEGQALNETAIEVGDDPRDWWVSELPPVDITRPTSIWLSQIGKAKMARDDIYFQFVRLAIGLSRGFPEVDIRPIWMEPTFSREAAGHGYQLTADARRQMEEMNERTGSVLFAHRDDASGTVLIHHLDKEKGQLAPAF